MSFKGVSMFTSGSYFVQLCGMMYASLVEAHPRNIPVQ